MYDARGSQTNSGGGLAFGLITIGVVTAIFFGILMFPSLTGPGKAPVPGVAAMAEVDENLLAAFDDTPTKAYIQKLQATFPSAAADLERDVKRARSRGADEVELGLLVLQAAEKDIEGSFDRLAKADVRYLNQMLDLSVENLGELSRSGAPYCKASDLAAIASLSEQQLYAAMFDRVGHGSGLYEFAIEFNGIVLDAIDDARKNPVTYGRLTPADEQATQMLIISVMTTHKS